MKKLWIIIGLVIFLAGGVWGQNIYQWTPGSGGGDSSTWEQSGNWTLISATAGTDYPGFDPGDSALIPGTATTINLTTPLPYDLTILTMNAGTLNLGGSGSLTVGTLTTGGAATIGGAIAATTLNVSGGTLAAASVNVTGASNINQNITTTGGQTYGGAVTLGAAVTLTGNSGSTVQFSGTVNGGQTLTVANANVQFDNTVGNSTPLTSIAVTGGGTTTINTTGIMTSGGQTY